MQTLKQAFLENKSGNVMLRVNKLSALNPKVVRYSDSLQTAAHT